MKRVLALVLAVFMLVGVLTACGAATETETTETAPAATAAEKTATETAEAPQEVAELTYWEMMWGPADTYPKAVENLVAKYNETHPGTKVTVQMTPWDNFYQTFLTAVSSGAAPDISTGGFAQAIQYAQMDEILYLDSIVEEWKNDGSGILDDMVPGALELHQFDGKQAGIPWCSDPRVIFYRKDVFKELGIETLPETWDDFLAVCQKIKDSKKMIPFGFASADRMATQTFLTFMFNNGAGLVTPDAVPDMGSKKVVETMQFFNTIYNKGYVPEGISSYKEADVERMFLSGEIAMWCTSPTQNIMNFPEVADNAGILNPLKGPSFNGAKSQNFAWINSIMAYKQTEYPEQAKQFVKWWIENNLPIWTEGKNSPFPIRLSYQNNDYFKNNWILQEAGSKVMPTAVSPVWPASEIFVEFAQIEGENYPGLAAQEALVSGTPDFQKIANDINEMCKAAFEK